MKEILEKISSKHKVFKGNGVPDDAIVSAEKLLGITFPAEYRKYLRECGVLSFGAHEIMGLGVEGYLNVVEATMKERGLGGTFPTDCVVIENVGIDGVLVIMDSAGRVYSLKGPSKRLVANSIAEYLESLLG